MRLLIDHGCKPLWFWLYAPVGGTCLAAAHPVSRKEAHDKHFSKAIQIPARRDGLPPVDSIR
jgi:hypothetical protein